MEQAMFRHAEHKSARATSAGSYSERAQLILNGGRGIATRLYQCPVFGIEAHGSAGGFASPFCSSSIECRSGERTNAIWPSRGGRLMVMPRFISRSQVA